ncbi:MAG: hypothetical protein NTX53_21220 [candidate division WOR-3 bacterium]|nr:hypothetical protein [candidate division WOR-3 bacterium]
MRLTRLIVGSVLLVISFASSQWLEITIPLPDSLGEIANPCAVVWDSVHNKVFVGGDSGVLVVDGVTNARIARVWTGGMVTALCLNPQNDKVYSTSARRNGDDDSTVTVIDGATYSILASLPVGHYPQALCYNPTDSLLNSLTRCQKERGV